LSRRGLSNTIVAIRPFERLHFTCDVRRMEVFGKLSWIEGGRTRLQTLFVRANSDVAVRYKLPRPILVRTSLLCPEALGWCGRRWVRTRHWRPQVTMSRKKKSLRVATEETTSAMHESTTVVNRGVHFFRDDSNTSSPSTRGPFDFSTSRIAPAPAPPVCSCSLVLGRRSTRAFDRRSPVVRCPASIRRPWTDAPTDRSTVDVMSAYALSSRGPRPPNPREGF
jgi:hypothetical protein